MQLDKTPIRDFVTKVLNRDDLRNKLNEWDLEVDWVSSVVSEHYSSMGMFFVPASQSQHFKKDIISHLEISPTILKELERKRIHKAKTRVSFKEEK
jgi:hypothetical protein